MSKEEIFIARPCRNCQVTDCGWHDTPDNFKLCEDYKVNLEGTNAIEREKFKSTLDKIRAEIIENSIEDYIYHGCGTDELIIDTSELLHILDKYKGESEE